jgi:hypothetical protein
MRKLTLAVISLAVGVYAQQTPAELLGKVRARVAESLDRLPRYMCTQTIDRAVYRPETQKSGSACEPDAAPVKVKLVSTDRLRLDVAMAANVEMYSWVGESRFDDQDLLQMVREGAISSGSFTAYLTALFRTDAARFSYRGGLIRDGRSFSEFGFVVPREKSRYLYGFGKNRVITGYDGTFLVDATTAELERLTIRTNLLPKETAACRATSTLDYSRVTLKGVDFFLPSVSLLRIVNTNGYQFENRAVFSGCHEFMGEATIKFDTSEEAPVTEPGHEQATKLPAIPAGISFGVAVTSAIDTTRAAAGDPVAAKLITPISNGFKILVPAGAPVGARIVRIEHNLRGVSLELRLETVEICGIPVPLRARFVVAPQDNVRFAKGQLGQWKGAVDIDSTALPDLPKGFLFRDCGEPCILQSGLESLWLTIKR